MKINTSKTKTVMPCGVLYTSTGQPYFLLHPQPVDRTMWQTDHQQMFLVVPTSPIDVIYPKNNKEGTIKEGTIVGEPIFSYPRHIVTSYPTIEYKYHADTILVVDLGDDSVSNIPSHQEVENLDNSVE